MEWKSSYNDTESCETSSQAESPSSTIYTSSSQVIQFPSMSAETVEKSCQTENQTITISQEQYDDLVSKCSAVFDLKEEIMKVKHMH